MTKELPPICAEGEHQYSPPSATNVATCGAGDGDNVYQEVLVMTAVSDNYQPVPGDVCRVCFQIFGQEPGVREPNQVLLFNDLASWEVGR